MRCEVLPDWLSFTIRGVEPVKVISDILGMDPALFQKLPYAWRTYQTVFEYQNIRVAYGALEDGSFTNMGVLVDMSGQGCRNFETMSKLGTQSEDGGFSENFMRLFEFLDGKLGYDGGAKTVNITKLDMAADDRDGLLDREDIIDRFLQEAIRTRTTSWDLLIGRKCKVKGGFTVYIGSKKSEVFTKIYDKEAEMKQNKLVDTGHWIRVETRFRHENAENFIHEVVKGEGKDVGKLFAKTLNDKFQFVNLDDSNMTRCSVCDWWSAFVEEVEKVRLVTRRAVQNTVFQLEKWITDQVAPTLYVLSQTIGWTGLKNIIDGAYTRVSEDEKKEAIILDFWEKKRLFEERNKALSNYGNVYGNADKFLKTYGYDLENEDSWERWGPIWEDEEANKAYMLLSGAEKEHIRTMLQWELKGESA